VALSDLLGERNAVEGCEPDGFCVAGGGGRRRVERVSSGETTLELIRIFVLLVGAAALVTILARRIRLPYTVALVAAGLVTGAFVQPLKVAITPELVLVVLLPALIFEASYQTDFSKLRPSIVGVFLLAGGYFAITAMRQSAHKLAGGDNYNQLSANSAVYEGNASLPKEKNYFSSDEQAPASASADGKDAADRMKLSGKAAGLDERSMATAAVAAGAAPYLGRLLAGTGTALLADCAKHPETVPLLKAVLNRAIADGATEIDVVVNIGKVLGGDWDYVSAELKAVNAACTTRGAILKVIFENDYLSDAPIIRLCEICTEVGVAFVKTSSGYGFVKQPNGDYNYRGATDHQLRLMRQHSGPNVQIKAAGGVRTLDDLLRVRTLGVTRIGATATEAILIEAVRRGLPGPVPAGLRP